MIAIGREMERQIKLCYHESHDIVSFSFKRPTRKEHRQHDDILLFNHRLSRLSCL